MAGRTALRTQLADISKPTRAHISRVRFDERSSVLVFFDPTLPPSDIDGLPRGIAPTPKGDTASSLVVLDVAAILLAKSKPAAQMWTPPDTPELVRSVSFGGALQHPASAAVIRAPLGPLPRSRMNAAASSAPVCVPPDSDFSRLASSRIRPASGVASLPFEQNPATRRSLDALSACAPGAPSRSAPEEDLGGAASHNPASSDVLIDDRGANRASVRKRTASAQSTVFLTAMPHGVYADPAEAVGSADVGAPPSARSPPSHSSADGLLRASPTLPVVRVTGGMSADVAIALGRRRAEAKRLAGSVMLAPPSAAIAASDLASGAAATSADRLACLADLLQSNASAASFATCAVESYVRCTPTATFLPEIAMGERVVVASPPMLVPAVVTSMDVPDEMMLEGASVVAPDSVLGEDMDTTSDFSDGDADTDMELSGALTLAEMAATAPASPHAGTADPDVIAVAVVPCSIRLVEDCAVGLHVSCAVTSASPVDPGLERPSVFLLLCDEPVLHGHGHGSPVDSTSTPVRASNVSSTAVLVTVCVASDTTNERGERCPSPVVSRGPQAIDISPPCVTMSLDDDPVLNGALNHGDFTIQGSSSASSSCLDSISSCIRAVGPLALPHAEGSDVSISEHSIFAADENSQVCEREGLHDQADPSHVRAVALLPVLDCPNESNRSVSYNATPNAAVELCLLAASASGGIRHSTHPTVPLDESMRVSQQEPFPVADVVEALPPPLESMHPPHTLSPPESLPFPPHPQALTLPHALSPPHLLPPPHALPPSPALLPPESLVPPHTILPPESIPPPHLLPLPYSLPPPHMLPPLHSLRARQQHQVDDGVSNNRENRLEATEIPSVVPYGNFDSPAIEITTQGCDGNASASWAQRIDSMFDGDSDDPSTSAAHVRGARDAQQRSVSARMVHADATYAPAVVVDDDEMQASSDAGSELNADVHSGDEKFSASPTRVRLSMRARALLQRRPLPLLCATSRGTRLSPTASATPTGSPDSRMTAGQQRLANLLVLQDTLHWGCDPGLAPAAGDAGEIVPDVRSPNSYDNSSSPQTRGLSDETSHNAGHHSRTFRAELPWPPLLVMREEPAQQLYLQCLADDEWLNSSPVAKAAAADAAAKAAALASAVLLREAAELHEHQLAAQLKFDATEAANRSGEAVLLRTLCNAPILRCGPKPPSYAQAVTPLLLSGMAGHPDYSAATSHMVDDEPLPRRSTAANEQSVHDISVVHAHGNLHMGQSDPPAGNILIRATQPGFVGSDGGGGGDYDFAMEAEDFQQSGPMVADESSAGGPVSATADPRATHASVFATTLPCDADVSSSSSRTSGAKRTRSVDPGYELSAPPSRRATMHSGGISGSTPRGLMQTPGPSMTCPPWALCDTIALETASDLRVSSLPSPLLSTNPGAAVAVSSFLSLLLLEPPPLYRSAASAFLADGYGHAPADFPAVRAASVVERTAHGLACAAALGVESGGWGGGHVGVECPSGPVLLHLRNVGVGGMRPVASHRGSHSTSEPSQRIRFDYDYASRPGGEFFDAEHVASFGSAAVMDFPTPTSETMEPGAAEANAAEAAAQLARASAAASATHASLFDH